jgi:hypothetical protein
METGRQDRHSITGVIAGQSAGEASADGHARLHKLFESLQIRRSAQPIGDVAGGVQYT